MALSRPFLKEEAMPKSNALVLLEEQLGAQQRELAYAKHPKTGRPDAIADIESSITATQDRIDELTGFDRDAVELARELEDVDAQGEAAGPGDETSGETYESLTQEELHAELANRGLAVSGTKDEQMTRLEEDDAASAAPETTATEGPPEKAVRPAPAPRKPKG